MESFAAAVPLASDGELFEEILKAYQRSVSAGQPYFNYSLSLQGHGPYGDEGYYWGEQGAYAVNNGSYTDKQHYVLENYLGSVASTNESLQKFTDALRTDTEPVVLVLFGDHNPALGADVYSAMGININTGTEDGFHNYYSTRYIIWANEAAKRILGDTFSGEGPAISPCFLMNQVFERCGWEGPPYLQALKDISEEVQVVHVSGVNMKNGRFVGEADAEASRAAAEFKCLEYGRRKQPLDSIYK